MNQKVTVIVPVYNVEEYLEDCLESIVNQTYHNLEIILINDGSTDKSDIICNEYRKKDNRIILINQKNSGLSSARNAGLKIMSGEWVTFVDSDDKISEKMIENMLLLSKENIDIVVCEHKKFTNKVILENVKEVVDVMTNIEVLEKLYSEKQVSFITAWAKLYNTKLFKDVYFPDKKIHEDVFTTYKLYGKAKEIVYTNAQYYFYRQREGSIMNSAFTIQKYDLLIGLYQMMKYVLNLPSFSKKIGVVGEFMEKLIFFYEKSINFDQLKQNEIKTKIIDEHRILLKKHWKEFNAKERLKFLIFSISPKCYFILRNFLKG